MNWASHTLNFLAFIAFHEYYDTSSTIQLPAILSSTKAVDMYYKSTKTDLQEHTVKIQAIKKGHLHNKRYDIQEV